MIVLIKNLKSDGSFGNGASQTNSTYFLLELANFQSNYKKKLVMQLFIFIILIQVQNIVL